MYANGCTLQRSLNGSIHLRVLSHHGNIKVITLNEVANNLQCGSNLLSAYYLAKQGFRHQPSKAGDFLSFLAKESI